MNLVSTNQWNGWFSGMGAGGVILQNVITAITPFLIGGLAIYFVYMIWKIGASLSKADGPEQRKEAKIKLGWLIFGLIVAVIGPTLVLIFMNTVGKTVQGTGTGTPAASNFIAEIITLKNPGLTYN